MSASPGGRIELLAPAGLPRVRAGDDLCALTCAALTAAGIGLRRGDVLVFAQKIVSKAEGRMVDLARVQPSAQAREVAARVTKDPRLVELILSESRRIVRERRDVLIVEHRLGFVMANAGVDQSNVADGATGEHALLLPADPDASAARLRDEFAQACGVELGVVINDSFGRPWRRGSVGVAIGCAGIESLQDLRGEPDLFGRRLQVTEVALADEIAAAASVLMGQAAQSLPVVVVRGLLHRGPVATASALLRPPVEDLFR